MKRCSEHADENGTNKRKGTEEEWKVNAKDYLPVLPGHLAWKVVRRGPDKSQNPHFTRRSRLCAEAAA
jgi:hypothetical protein